MYFLVQLFSWKWRIVVENVGILKIPTIFIPNSVDYAIFRSKLLALRALLSNVKPGGYFVRY